MEMETVAAIPKYNLTEDQEKKLILREYRSLLRSLKPKLKLGDKELIRSAFEMAADAHKTMRRKSGEPYILHPLAVARICSEEIGLGVRSTICALLHDTVEDTDITLEDIEREFGGEIARIVDGLTKISNVVDVNASRQAENFKKILLTLTDDPRVILIKLADRLHNMRTLDSMKREKQLKIASETVYVYAPLAHRMGLYTIKTELEDLAMKYLEPEEYREIARKLSETKRERSRYINEFVKPLKEKLDQGGFDFDIYGRPKSIHSIWNKMRKKGVAFEEVSPATARTASATDPTAARRPPTRPSSPPQRTSPRTRQRTAFTRRARGPPRRKPWRCSATRSSARPSTWSPARAAWPASCAPGRSAPACPGPACRWTSATPTTSQPDPPRGRSCGTSTAGGRADTSSKHTLTSSLGVV